MLPKHFYQKHFGLELGFVPAIEISVLLRLLIHNVNPAKGMDEDLVFRDPLSVYMTSPTNLL